MQICSLLPSATEIVCALGLQDQLAGISHECDYPEGVRKKPSVVKTLIQTEGRTPEEIDRQVRETMASRGTLYVADERRLQEIRPDLVLTQDLCRVCAPSGEDLGAVIRNLPNRPKVLSLNPTSVDGILETILEVGRATGSEDRASKFVNGLRDRIARVRERASKARNRPRVALLEWLEPLFACGHWCPEVVSIAGGEEVLGKAGQDSRRVEWDEFLRIAPDLLCLSPCGYHLDRVLRAAEVLPKRAEWRELPAVRNGKVYAVDADSYFARPGPRVVDGIELLAHLFQPELFEWKGPSDAFRRFEG